MAGLLWRLEGLWLGLQQGTRDAGGIKMLGGGGGKKSQPDQVQRCRLDHQYDSDLLPERHPPQAGMGIGHGCVTNPMLANANLPQNKRTIVRFVEKSGTP
jgi:hypothetical protein